MRKKHAIASTLLLISFVTMHAMFVRTARLPQAQQAIRQQRRLLQTRPQTTLQKSVTQTPLTTPTQTPISRQAGTWSYWTALKNKVFGSYTTPSTPLVATYEPSKTITFARIDAIKTLPEAEKLLKNTTEEERNSLTTKAGIADAMCCGLIFLKKNAQPSIIYKTTALMNLTRMQLMILMCQKNYKALFLQPSTKHT